jgi:hypothetical protein
MLLLLVSWCLWVFAVEGAPQQSVEEHLRRGFEFGRLALLSFSEKVKFGQSTVLVVVDETRMPLAA